MAIQYVGGNTAAKAGATSGDTTIALNSGLTGGLAGAASSGDFVVASFGTGSGSAEDGTLSITDGTNPYTLMGSELFSSDNRSSNLRVGYKFITADTAVTFGPTSDVDHAGAMSVRVYRGVDTSSPMDVAVVTATGINTAIPNPAAITPTTAGAYIGVVASNGHRRFADTPVMSASDLTAFHYINSDDNEDCTLGAGHVAWTSGAFDPAVWGWTGTDSVAESWCAVTYALRPSAGAVGSRVLGGLLQGKGLVGPWL